MLLFFLGETFGRKKTAGTKFHQRQAQKKNGFFNGDRFQKSINGARGSARGVKWEVKGGLTYVPVGWSRPFFVP